VPRTPNPERDALRDAVRVANDELRRARALAETTRSPLPRGVRADLLEAELRSVEALLALH
jgi:hypothetical protein